MATINPKLDGLWFETQLINPDHPRKTGFPSIEDRVTGSSQTNATVSQFNDARIGIFTRHWSAIPQTTMCFLTGMMVCQRLGTLFNFLHENSCYEAKKRDGKIARASIDIPTTQFAPPALESSSTKGGGCASRESTASYS